MRHEPQGDDDRGHHEHLVEFVVVERVIGDGPEQHPRKAGLAEAAHDALNHCCVFATPGSAQRARHTQMFAQRRTCVLGPERPTFLQ